MAWPGRNVDLMRSTSMSCKHSSDAELPSRFISMPHRWNTDSGSPSRITGGNPKPKYSPSATLKSCGKMPGRCWCRRLTESLLSNEKKHRLRAATSSRRSYASSTSMPRAAHSIASSSSGPSARPQPWSSRRIMDCCSGVSSSIAFTTLRPNALSRASVLSTITRIGLPLPRWSSSSILIRMGLVAAVVYRMAVSGWRCAFRAALISFGERCRMSMGSCVVAGTKKEGKVHRSGDFSDDGSIRLHNPAIVNLASDRSGGAVVDDGDDNSVGGVGVDWGDKLRRPCACVCCRCLLIISANISSTFSFRSCSSQLNSRMRSNTFWGWLEWMWSFTMSPLTLPLPLPSSPRRFAGAPTHATESPYSAASSPVTDPTTSSFVAPSFNRMTASVQYRYLWSQPAWSTCSW
mmetsp:Transcript_11298/g.32457  ORF Transcript_11298/g.32457 Transcript_11298/m.32457 type:complete len:405 (-) Transcript_11298:120-1334(-)